MMMITVTTVTIIFSFGFCLTSQSIWSYSQISYYSFLHLRFLLQNCYPCQNDIRKICLELKIRASTFVQ